MYPAEKKKGFLFTYLLASFIRLFDNSDEKNTIRLSDNCYW